MTSRVEPSHGGRTHVLLDLDGTLSDSEPGILNSLQWAFMIEGFRIPTEDEVRSVIGPPLEQGLPSIGIPDDALDRVIDRYRERYADTGAYENTLYDGIVDMLDRARRRRLLALGRHRQAGGDGRRHRHDRHQRHHGRHQRHHGGRHQRHHGRHHCRRDHCVHRCVGAGAVRLLGPGRGRLNDLQLAHGIGEDFAL